jgi:hypothetical protein
MERALLILGFCALCTGFRYLRQNPEIWNSKMVTKIGNVVGCVTVIFCVGLAIKSLMDVTERRSNMQQYQQYHYGKQQEKAAFMKQYHKLMSK